MNPKTSGLSRSNGSLIRVFAPGVTAPPGVPMSLRNVFGRVGPGSPKLNANLLELMADGGGLILGDC